MSLINCKECDKKISKNSKSCPNCGSRKNRSFIKRHPFISFGAFLFFLLIINVGMIDEKDKVERQSYVKNSEVVNNKVENTKSVSSWKYSESKDEMRNSTSKFANNESLNTVNLDFPYQESKMQITIRNNNNENNVMLQVIGIFSCANRDCSVNVKFDDKSIQKYNFIKTSSGNSDVVFIEDEQKFIEEIKKAKKVIIEAPLFKAGSVQYSFDINNLEWNN